MNMPSARIGLRTGADDAELTRLDNELDRLGAELTKRHPDLRLPIRVDWPQHSLLALERERAWWLGPAECDPHRDQRGRVPVPPVPRTRLKELARRGIPFQRVAIAHELDRAGPVRDLLPALRQGPRTCTAETARMVVGSPPAHPRVTWAAHLLATLAGGTSSAVGLVAETVLDPIVFGVVAPRAPRPGDVTLWFPLVAWRW
jgi:hypothetical protein